MADVTLNTFSSAYRKINILAFQDFIVYQDSSVSKLQRQDGKIPTAVSELYQEVRRKVLETATDAGNRQCLKKENFRRRAFTAENISRK